MKKFVYTTIALLMLAISANAEAQSKLFIKEASLEAPLSTYDPCTMDSYYGSAAYSYAENDATLECRSEGFVDCLTVGGRVFTVISHEFPGYKACHAKVTVRGWR